MIPASVLTWNPRVRLYLSILGFVVTWGFTIGLCMLVLVGAASGHWFVSVAALLLIPLAFMGLGFFAHLAP